jgi:hypothetical protein
MARRGNYGLMNLKLITRSNQPASWKEAVPEQHAPGQEGSYFQSDTNLVTTILKPAFPFWFPMMSVGKPTSVFFTLQYSIQIIS